MGEGIGIYFPWEGSDGPEKVGNLWSNRILSLMKVHSLVLEILLISCKSWKTVEFYKW